MAMYFPKFFFLRFKTMGTNYGRKTGSIFTWDTNITAISEKRIELRNPSLEPSNATHGLLQMTQPN